jgi:NADH dehydrogenase [ubiquinone] 1 alpha subcomplex assembly factor 7
MLNKLDIAELLNQPLPLVNVLKDEITNKGPMSFAHYMDRCLLHEKHGYYMKKDVFNTKGDFITSPEISQMFGEMIGVWVVNFLSTIRAIDLDNPIKSATNRKISLVEFGPGRGTLMADIVKVLQQFKLLNGLEINFIEYSPFMRKMQQENITKLLQKHNIWMKYEYDESKKSKMEEFTNENKDQFIRLRWFSMYEQFLYENHGLDMKTLKDPVPIVSIAHEFFDALPVHIFQFTKSQGWCEKLVTVSSDPLKKKQFDFVLSPGPNDNVHKILKPEQTFSKEVAATLEEGDTVEVSPKSLVITNSLCELINKVNGASLIIDYGENHALSNSVRGIRNHKYVENDMLLEFPGEVDLSAYVNFAALAEAAKKNSEMAAFGPIPQGVFLESMGIETRVEMLCKTASPAVAERLKSEYERLVSPDEMGEIYKVQYLGKKGNGEIFPFVKPEDTQVFY